MSRKAVQGKLPIARADVVLLAAPVLVSRLVLLVSCAVQAQIISSEPSNKGCSG